MKRERCLRQLIDISVAGSSSLFFTHKIISKKNSGKKTHLVRILRQQQDFTDFAVRFMTDISEIYIRLFRYGFFGALF